MPDTVIVRPATHEDLSGFARLREPSPSSGEGTGSGEDRRRCGLEMMLNNGRGRVLAAEAADGTVVGLCSGQLTISTVDGGPAVLIRDVFVREDWRGLGIGPRLMDALGVWAREDEAARLSLLADLDDVPAPGWRVVPAGHGPLLPPRGTDCNS